MSFIERAAWAIIPARGGSKSVPKKNIKDFYGYPLLAFSIAAAKLSDRITRVIVSTDSQEIADIAEEYGAEIPFLRPEAISRDDSTDLEFMQHAIQYFIKEEGLCAEYMVHLRPTTPLREPRIVDTAIDMISEKEGVTSLRSGHRCIHPPYKWFVSGENGLWNPLMASSCDEANNPRQAFPKVYIPNGYVDVIKSEYVLCKGALHGDRLLGFETEEVIDIDTASDMEKLALFPSSMQAFHILKDYLSGLHK